MTVQEILILCADISDRKDLATYLIEGSSDISPDTSFDAETLLKCYNITISEIATEYYRLKTIEEFSTENGILDYEKLKENPLAIVKVYNNKEVKQYINDNVNNHNSESSDVITGATISSRGVIQAVISACENFNSFLGENNESIN